jgi:hypothetical protein
MATTGYSLAATSRIHTATNHHHSHFKLWFFHVVILGINRQLAYGY